MTEVKRIEALLNEFADSVVNHRVNMCRNHVTANKYFDRYCRASEQLMALGEDGRMALAQLLDDSRASVRLVAAMDLIAFFPERAIKVLEAEWVANGEMATESLVTLEKWKRGMIANREL